MTFNSRTQRGSIKPQNVSAIAQKLVDSLEAIKLRCQKMKKATLPFPELDDLVMRGQQIARLTTCADASMHDAASISQQLLELSENLNSHFEKIEDRLGDIPFVSRPVTPTSPTPAPYQPPSDLSILSGKRHDSLYLLDGNIVLIAPSSDNMLIIFRVHKSMLAFQSPVFKSMFTLPAADDNQDVFDGVPFVHMPDDSTDLESLLNALYDPSALPQKRFNPDTPIHVRGVLSLATKYEMEALRSRIITHIVADWPETLNEWDRFDSELRALEIEQEQDDFMTENEEDLTNFNDKIPEPAAALRLAVDFDIPSILPAIFYYLYSLSVTWNDWSASTVPKRANDSARAARWNLLKADDLRRLMRIREGLADHIFSDIAMECSKKCDQQSVCMASLLNIHNSVRDARDPLRQLVAVVEAFPWKNVCKFCRELAWEELEDKRESIWSKIVALVGISSA